jgi:hypothetical protein
LRDRREDASEQGGQRLNALKHGVYAHALLMPGEDPAEYERQRMGLYRTYRPQTVDEARCVEILAECGWLHDRYLPVQARFDTQWRAPEADAAGRVCEPPGHLRIHSSTDVMKHRLWNVRALTKAREQLLLLQKQRRLGLVEGALMLPAGCYVDRSGTVLGPISASAQQPVPVVAQAPQQPAPTVAEAPEQPAPMQPASQPPAPQPQPEAPVAPPPSPCQPADVAASGSTGAGIGENLEQKENGTTAAPPGAVPFEQIYLDPCDLMLARANARRDAQRAAQRQKAAS